MPVPASSGTALSANWMPEPEAGGASETISERIANFLVQTNFSDLPAGVVRKAKEQIVFFFGRAFEGLPTEEGIQLRRIAPLIQQTTGGATVIAERFRLLPNDAAFANCSLMRGSQGRDDVIWPAGIHAGVITLPTALATAEIRRSSGKEMVLALVLGYEVLGKLARASDPWRAAQPHRPTNVYGGFGPTTVAGSLLKLDRDHMANALGYAANLSKGIAEGGMMDHYYSLINRNGMLAAQLAQVGGAPYSRTTIEGQTGLYRSYFGEVPSSLTGLVNNLGSDWEILTAEQKRYPGTGQNTVAIELLLDLVKTKKLEIDQVERIDVFEVDDLEALSRKNEVSSRGPFARPVQAYSSAPYALALVLLDGDVRVERYLDDANFNDTIVARVMQKIRIFFEKGHGPRYCRLEIHTTDHRKIVREEENFRYQFPPSVWGEWLQSCGKHLLPLEQLRRLEQLIADLDHVKDVSELMACVVPEPDRGVAHDS
jgi:2-methylcitrate dehydratase PrpD